MTETKPQPVARDLFLWGLLMAAVLGLSLLAIGPVFNLLPKGQTVTFVEVFERTSGTCPTSDATACGFSPSTVTLATGKSLLFRNAGSLSHTVTSSNSTSSGPLFDSGTISAEGAYAFELSATPGTYGYFCSFHPWMTGTVTVG